MEEPIDLIYDAVEDLREIGELLARPYSPAQIVDLGYIILAKNRLFRGDIRKWMRRPDEDKSWADFKVFSPKHIRNLETPMPP